MDPLSLSASIIAVLQLAGTILPYLNDVRNATKDQTQLAVEASNIYSLLTSLRFRVEQSNGDDPCFIAVRNLGREHGPLDQVKEALEYLASKSEPARGIKRVSKQLMWKFEKSELQEVLRKIERVKTLVNIALTSDMFSLSQAMNKELNAMEREVSKINHGVTALHDGQQRIGADFSDISVGVTALNIWQHEEEHRKIEEWLSPIDFRSRQQEILRGAQAGTRQWLFDAKEFQDWIDADRGTLWCPGIPGAGKTVTSSIIIEHLQSRFVNENVAVTCLFCNCRDREAQSAEIFMANLLKQIIQQKQTVSQEIKDLYGQCERGRPTFTQSTRLFGHEISQFSQVFVIIDALDETSEHEDIRRLVISELQSQPVSLLVTSRYEKSIERVFETALRLEIRATPADVQTYVKARIPFESLLARHIQADSSLDEIIVNKIVEKSKGMFLMARFHMDSLVTKTKRKDVRKALEVLPPELDEIYDQTIKRIEEQGKDYSDLAKRVLLWVSSTFRPMSPVELQLAIAVQPGMTKLDDEDLDEQDLLVSVCAGLVVLDAETDTLRFVPSHRANHARITKDTLAIDAVLSFLNQSKKVARAFIIGYALQGFKQILVELPSPIHIAAMYGLTYVTQRLLNRGTPADFRDSHGRTPLFLAAMYGYGNVVALLAPRDDVDVNAIDHKGHTPLDAAVGDDMVLHNFLHGSSDFYAQHKTIVRLLLEKGSRVPTFDTYLRNRRLYTDSKKRPSYSKWAKGQFLTETK